MRLAAPAAALLAVLAVAACGRKPVEPRDPAARGLGPVTAHIRIPKAGLAMRIPQGAAFSQLLRPGIFRVGIGTGFVSGLGYRRSEPLPKGSAELRAARRRLAAQVRRRDRGFRSSGGGLTRVAGAPAVEESGRQVIARQEFQTRSVHVFKNKVEYVFELLTPPREFARADRRVFSPMLRSLKLTGHLVVPKPGKQTKKR